MAKSGRSISARVLAESHFDLQRIRAARYEVFLTIDDFENANGDDFEEALNEMDKISRYETRALVEDQAVAFLLKNGRYRPLRRFDRVKRDSSRGEPRMSSRCLHTR